MSPQRFGVRIGLLAALVGVPAASGQVTLISQERLIAHDMRWENQPPLPEGRGSSFGTASWATFGPFNMFSSSAIPTAPRDPYVATFRSLASSLSPNNIRGAGNAVATLTVPEDHIAARALARSSMRVAFEVNGPTRFRLIATASLDVGQRDYSHSLVAVRLTGPDTTIFEGQIAGENDPDIAVDQYGFLLPGVYEVLASAAPRVENTSNALDAEDSASFELELRMGCPGDFDFDGTIGSPDLFGFLTAYFAQDPSAEYTGDGAVTSEDFFVFLASFFEGC